jgi:hypothetical protein
VNLANFGALLIARKMLHGIQLLFGAV